MMSLKSGYSPNLVSASNSIGQTINEIIPRLDLGLLGMPRCSPVRSMESFLFINNIELPIVNLLPNAYA